MASLSHFAIVAGRMRQHWVGKKRAVSRCAELSIFKEAREG